MTTRHRVALFSRLISSSALLRICLFMNQPMFVEVLDQLRHQAPPILAVKISM